MRCFSFFFAASAAFLILLACGEKKTEPATQQAHTQAEPAHSKPPEPADHRPAIVAFGDSLTAGFGAEPGHSYPDYLQRDLDQAGLPWRVINQGVSGDTTTDGVNRLGEVLDSKPRIVIVEFGGNDGLRGLPIETTRVNLDQIVTTLRAAGIQIVLAGMTLPPNYGPDYIRAFENIYVDLATRYQLTRIPFLLEGVATKRELMQRDDLHPTAEGNAVVAQTVLRKLRPLLR